MVNDNLVFTMKSYTIKGHIDKLIELVKSDESVKQINDVMAIQLLYELQDNLAQQYEGGTLKEGASEVVDNFLSRLDSALFGRDIDIDDNPQSFKADEGSVIGRYYKDGESKADEILIHLLALHLKLLVNPPNGKECPTCEKYVGNYRRCANCGTRLRKDSNMKIPKFSFKKVAIFIVIVLLLGTLIPCLQIIPEGSTGIRVTMGKVDKNLIQPGPTYKIPFIQDIKTVNNKQQTYKFSDRIWGESSEQTVVFMEGVSVSYQIMPEYSVWLYTNVTDYENNALPLTIVSSAMKAAMVELKTDLVTNRANIEPIAVDKLQKALNDKYEGREVVHITSLNIDNMDFEDNYNKAIEQRQIAKLEYEKQQTEIKTQIEKANADKQEREIKAQAAANEKKIAADAEAESIKTVADAQAEANKKLANSITKDLVDYTKVEKWDGKLPQVSGGSAIIDMKDSSAALNDGN